MVIWRLYFTLRRERVDAVVLIGRNPHAFVVMVEMIFFDLPIVTGVVFRNGI